MIDSAVKRVALRLLSVLKLLVKVRKNANRKKGTEMYRECVQQVVSSVSAKLKQ